MPQLHVKHVPFNFKINDLPTDLYSHRQFATWRPQDLESGWYYLGPAANNGESTGCDGVIVKSATDDIPALVPITTWKKVWSDSDEGWNDVNSVEYALWKGFPALEHRTDYTAVGGFFTRHSRSASASGPGKEETKGMMAVHKDCLVVVNAGKQIWNDSDVGTFNSQAASVWAISVDGHLQAVDTGAFVPADIRDTSPRDTYALDRKCIVRKGTTATPLRRI